MGAIADHAVYFVFLLIMVFLVLTNYRGLTAIMKQGGTSLSQVSKVLQGR